MFQISYLLNSKFYIYFFTLSVPTFAEDYMTCTIVIECYSSKTSSQSNLTFSKSGPFKRSKIFPICLQWKYLKVRGYRMTLRQELSFATLLRNVRVSSWSDQKAACFMLLTIFYETSYEIQCIVAIHIRKCPFTYVNPKIK